MLSVLDLLRDLDSGRLTIQGIFDRVEEAIDRREKTVKAFAHLDLASAHKRSSNAVGGALAGLPFGVKDIIDTAEMPTEYGSPIWADWRPRADAPVVTLAKRAGAVVLGKTRTTELAHMHPTVTTNPHDPARTPGGSSSGSAAAVAAGMVPFAFGTQTAGSTIRPAAFCGIAGVKPSFRLLPTVGVKTFSWHLDTVGLFAPHVADCAFVLSAITGRALRVDTKNFGAPRIGFVRTHRWDEAEPEMRRALESVARRATARGATVVDVTLPSLFAEAADAHRIINDFEGAESLAWEYDTHGAALSPELRAVLDHGRHLDPTAYDAARSTAHAARRKFADAFEDVDVLLTPSAPGAAPEGLGSTGNPKFNALWTLLGVPCVNVPGLVDGSGLPLGVQIVAPFGKDRTALAAADWLERALARG
ncbi:amidase [Chthonobacter rhizosphaerae]|uniref:amidase n=1 Tax=Chthonobacter rhizosphaerae TaxID=2735553 RepID=UPI0015EF8584|nr:amidase [Chthonobacter rhizosphaerae]